RPDSCPMDFSAARAGTPSELRETVVAPKKKAWERARGGEAAAKPYIQARLVGVPVRLLTPRAALPEADVDFAWRLARDTWHGLDALSDRENGLPMDNVRLTPASEGIGAIQIGDYASGTDIGLYLVAIVAARELDLISPDDARTKIRVILDTLSRLEVYRGFLFNFYDTTSLERTSNFVSFVDASWLTAGLTVVLR